MVVAPPPVVEDKPTLLILTQLCQLIKITPWEWEGNTPMEPQQTEDLPRTPGRVSLNLDLDSQVEILEFVEEEDQHGRTLSIKQRKKKKAMKRKHESEQPSEEWRKEK